MGTRGAFGARWETLSLAHARTVAPGRPRCARGKHAPTRSLLVGPASFPDRDLVFQDLPLPLVPGMRPNLPPHAPARARNASRAPERERAAPRLLPPRAQRRAPLLARAAPRLLPPRAQRRVSSRAQRRVSSRARAAPRLLLPRAKRRVSSPRA